MKRLLAYLALFAIAELGAKLWIEHHGNALDRTRGILEADTSLGWKQRSGLKTTFYGYPLETNEHGFRERPFAQLPPGRKRLLVLGPSSTFGWGVAVEDTYARKLEASPGLERFCVVNAGEIGYSTAQGRILFAQDYVRAVKPEVVVIAYGINDLDQNRFYFQSPRTDREELALAHSPMAIRLSRLLFSSNLVTVLVKTAAAFVSLPPQSSPRIRVPPADFAENIHALVLAAKPAKVILLTTAIHMPVADAPDKIRSEVDRINRGVASYNEILRAEARRDGVLLGEIGNWLSGQSDDFVDPVHFSAKGNALIAKGLAAMLAESKMERTGKP